MTEFINPDFYKRYTWQYNGRARDFKRRIPYRREVEDRRPARHRRGDNIGEPRQPERPPSTVINVISGGNVHVVRNQLPRKKVKPYPTILISDMAPERKRSRAEEVTSFSEKDQGDIMGPHDDPIGLNLKIQTPRVRKQTK